MSDNKKYSVDPAWAIVMKDADIDPVSVARRASLPDDLFSRKDFKVTPEQFFRMWSALEEEAADPFFALKLGQNAPFEAFDAPLFAALCSPNLDAALNRLALFKRLVVPMKIELKKTNEATTAFFLALDESHDVPPSILALEIVFVVSLARRGTREPIGPAAVTMPFERAKRKKYSEYFGVDPVRDEVASVSFVARDAQRPFITEHEAMWQFFEPELQRRLSTLDGDSMFTERVRASLLELLPSGQGSAVDVAAKLAVSPRSLQRRLREEQTTFKAEVSQVRQESGEALPSQVRPPVQADCLPVGLQRSKFVHTRIPRNNGEHAARVPERESTQLIENRSISLNTIRATNVCYGLLKPAGQLNGAGLAGADPVVWPQHFEHLVKRKNVFERWDIATRIQENHTRKTRHSMRSANEP